MSALTVDRHGLNLFKRKCGVMMNQTHESKISRRYRLGFLIGAVAFLVILLIANLDAVNHWLGKLLQILSPLTTGLIIAYLANPFFRLFEQKLLLHISQPRLRRTLALILTYLVLIAIITGLILLIIPQLFDSIQNFINNFDSYMSGVVEQINKLLHSLNQKLPVGEDGAPFFSPLNKDTILEKASSLWNSLIESAKNNIRPEHMGAVREWLESTAKIFIDAFFGVFISVFLLASKEKCYAQVMRFRHAYLGDKFNQAITKFISIADRSFGGFLRGKLLDSCIVGCLVYVACLIFQIPYAILVAVIVGITDIVPVIGPFVGVIPTAIIILLTDPVKVIVFVLSILVIQQIDGNIIAPKILGENTGVSSLCVLISILVMGDLMGLVGMVLAVPLFATVIELGKLWMDKRLSAKGLSGDLDDYYAEDALPDLTAEEVPPSEYVAPEAAYTTVPSFANGEGNLTASEQLQLRTYALVKKHGSLTKLSDEELIQLAKEAMTDDTPDGDEPKSQSEGGSSV